MPEVTWWGHATTTVQDSGVRVLTDPVLTRRLGHLRRLRGPVPDRDAVSADIVVISHLHSDHLHLPSLASLQHGATVVVPAGAVSIVRGLRRVARARRLRLLEAVPGDEFEAGPVTVRAVPAEHDGRRWPIGPGRVQSLGYVVTGEARTYFAGDTDLYGSMPDEVGRCDVALLPVGGWGPKLGAGHLNAERAAHALARLGSAAAVPIHYGTFCPVGLGLRPGRWFSGPGHDFAAHASAKAPTATVRVLAPGQTADLAGSAVW